MESFLFDLKDFIFIAVQNSLPNLSKIDKMRLRKKSRRSRRCERWPVYGLKFKAQSKPVFWICCSFHRIDDLREEK